MNPKEKLAALQKELLGIQTAAKAEGRDFTDDELTLIEAKSAEAADLKARIERIEKSEQSLANLIELGKSDADAVDNPDEFAGVSLGERFAKSPGYTQFRKQHPSGVGAGTPVKIDSARIGSMKDFFANRRTAKALTTTDAHPQNIRVPMVDLVDRPRLTLLDLISRGETAGNFEYVQVTSVTRNADVVPEATSGADAAALKPISDMTTELADAKVFTYADGYDVTNQLLADAPAFSSYLNTELEYSLDSIIEHYLLNGTGNSGEPLGLLNTTGVQQQAIASGNDPMDLVKAARRAITKVTTLKGGTVTAIVLSPEDDEEIDLMQDQQDRFYGQGPFGVAPPTLWGRPRVVSERLNPGQFALGDFRQIALLDREGLAIQAFNQHKDYAQRNMTYVRAELRAAQVIWKPGHLVVGQRSGS